MRAYHLMSERWALEALRLRRLKLALLEDMNDPFEFLGADQRNASDRTAFPILKAEINQTIGVLCFSRAWSDPVLWSHYGDRHHGICLGFDILDQWAKEVTYQGNRLVTDLEHAFERENLDDLPLKLLTTKYEHWRYEDEVRLVLRLEDVQFENGHYFLRFCDALCLREVTIGLRCPLPQSRIQEIVSVVDPDVTIRKARLASRSYKVV